MSLDKRRENLQRALAALERFVAQADSEAARAGVVQAFEFTFEQMWQALKEIAERQGLHAASPRLALTHAYRLGFIEGENVWLSMLDDRNATSHTYNEPFAAAMFQRICALYLPAFRLAAERIAKEAT